MLFHTKMTFNKRRGSTPEEIFESDLDFPDLTIELFRKRLVETITWCSPRVDFDKPETCLRSDELAIEKKALYFEYASANAESVVSRREALLQGKPLFQLTNEIYSLGRILIFEFNHCLYEGAVSYETRKYIGLDEFPPWDTWICTAGEGNDEVLFCWVPAVFVEEVTTSFLVMSTPWLTWVVASDQALV